LPFGKFKWLPQNLRDFFIFRENIHDNSPMHVCAKGGLSMENIDTLLGLEGLRSTGIKMCPDENGSDSIYVDCVPVRKPPCPVCGSFYSHIDRYSVRTVQDLDCSGKKVYLNIRITRYSCKEPVPGKPSKICGKTFQANVEMIDQKARLTKRFRNVLADEALTIPFQKVAEAYSVSDMTVRRALEAYFEEKEQWRKENFYCPAGIGIDENHLNGQYCLVITDNDQNTLIDIFDNKDPETVCDVLKELKKEDTLQYVTMDLCSEYRAAVREVFGQKVDIIADHFHVQKLVNNAMMETRLNLIDRLSGKERSGTKYNANLFKKNLENLTDYDKECLARSFKAIPGTDMAYALKEAFRSIYSFKRREAAEKAFERFCKEIPEAEEFEPFRKVCRTIRQWYKEVFNYFDYDRASNGFTEAENGIISRRNAQGNGYSFQILRGLAMYGKSSTAFHPNRQLESKKVLPSTL
jgi:transposase